MKVKELINILKEVDQEAVVFAEANSPRNGKVGSRILCEDLKEIVYNKQAWAVSLSFSGSNVMSEDRMWVILA